MTLTTSVHLFVSAHLIVREQNARLELAEYYLFQYGLEFEHRNNLKFSDREVWANSADPDQTAPRADQTAPKIPEFTDARKLCGNLPLIQTKRPTPRVFHQKNAIGIANSEDPDQTAPRGAV